MASSIPVSDCRMQVRIDTEFGDHYIRTKHNNLRCFPRCAVLHVEHRFCGRPIQATVIMDEPDQSSNRDFILVGELRNEQSLPAFELGQNCTRIMLDQVRSKLFIGQETGRTGGEIRFIFPPPRKWHLPGKLRSSYRHVCQVYIISGDTTVATAISKSFRINPVWRTEEDAASVEQGHSGAQVNLRRLSCVSDITHPPKRMHMENRKPFPDEGISLPDAPLSLQSFRFNATQPVVPTSVRCIPSLTEIKDGSQVRQMPMLSTMLSLSLQPPSGLPAYDTQSFNVRAQQTTGPISRVMLPSSGSNRPQGAIIQSKLVYGPVPCAQMPFITQHSAAHMNVAPIVSSMSQFLVPNMAIGGRSIQSNSMRVKYPTPPTEFLFPLVQTQPNTYCPAPYPYYEPPRNG